ncbi:hypothetical protein GGR51DRAFT_534416 [Nemania sp. FL0031]|nr:hypothetical protein GGR51DRAFT_534416 [Nemania sp. FL0031]
MDAATVARQRVAARAVGRTPEEHAALEQALARRRWRALLPHASPVVSRPVQQLRQYFTEFENRHTGHIRSQPLASPTRDSQIRVDDNREASPAVKMPEYLHEIEDGDIYETFKIIYTRSDNPERDHHLFPYFEYAMFRAKVAAAKAGPGNLPVLGVPPARKSKPKYNPQNVRGAGWHRRGYRDHGMMWINVRTGSYGPTCGRDEGENETLSKFVESIFSSNERKYPEGWYCDLFFRKKSLTRCLVDLENYGLDTELVLVKDYFDGGETVYFKLFGEAGEQQDQIRFG